MNVSLPPADTQRPVHPLLTEQECRDLLERERERVAGQSPRRTADEQHQPSIEDEDEDEDNWVLWLRAWEENAREWY